MPVSAPQLCAVRDAANLCVNPATGEQYVCAMGSPNSKAMLNAGVLVAKPSASLLAKYKADLSKVTRPYATLPEQEFLSSYYLQADTDKSVYKDADANKFRFISADYGQCWATGEQMSRAKIIHNCGPFKYGHHPMCVWDGDRKSVV